MYRYWVPQKLANNAGIQGSRTEQIGKKDEKSKSFAYVALKEILNYEINIFLPARTMAYRFMPEH
jgi:hypothetical protein